jgi:hypothetical protein
LTRTARASWSGTVPEGGGRLALGSALLASEDLKRAYLGR